MTHDETITKPGERRMTIENDLQTYGAGVLRILEQTEEWNSGTVDEIAELAHDLGLSYANEYMEFTRSGRVLAYHQMPGETT